MLKYMYGMFTPNLFLATQLGEYTDFNGTRQHKYSAVLSTPKKVLDYKTESC